MKSPNQSGLVLTVGGKAGGASILSGVEPFDKLRTTASPVELDRRDAFGTSFRRQPFVRSLRGECSGIYRGNDRRWVLKRWGSAEAEHGRQLAEEGGMLAGEAGGKASGA